jgi:hypothetical protein
VINCRNAVGTRFLQQISCKKLWFLIAVFPVVMACTCSKGSRSIGGKDSLATETARTFVIDQAAVQIDLDEIAGKAHPFGSERQHEVGDWLLKRIDTIGGLGVEFKFTSDTPNPQLLLNPSSPAELTIAKTGRNIVAIPKTVDLPKCLLLIGSHYDSKIIAGTEYLGANDSGSSSVLLLQIMAHLQKLPAREKLECTIAMIWFDAEEAVLADWDAGERLHPAKIQDNTYGSRDFVKHLSDCEYGGRKSRCVDVSGGKIPVIGLILLDMVGSPGLKINLEANSTIELRSLLVDAAAAISAEQHINPVPQAIEDDHLPFLRNGIPAIDLIDFSHLDFWHKEGDESRKISLESIEIAGKLSLYVAISVASDPKAVLNLSDP